MDSTARTIDVVTINLWGPNGPARARMDDLGAWLRREAPDVLLLQEVEHVDGVSQAELLAERGGYAHVDAVRSGRGPRGGEGLAVLARHALERVPPVRLPRAPLDSPRALQQVDLYVASTVIRVANTHLAWRLGATPARVKQARAIAAALPAPPLPIVLGGDLNDEPGSAPLRALEAAGLTDCCATAPTPRVTFDLANHFLWQPELAGRRVDHILVRGLRLASVDVALDGTDGPVVSDHYGVRAIIQLAADC